MPSTYTTNLGIEKIGTGEQSGTWGTTTNTNLDLIDQAVNGVVQVTLASAGTSGSPNDLPINNGATSDGRNKFIEFVDGGDLGATAYVQLTPNDADKVAFFRNSLTGGRSVIIFQGTYNASNDFEIPSGADVVLKFDGAGAGATVTQVFEDLTISAVTLSSGVTASSILDEDNMASDSDTALATQQSIKAYVDSQVGTVDTLAEILANGNTSGATDLVIDSGQVLTTNTINETTAASGVTIDSVLLKDDGVNATNLEITNLKANDGTSAGSIADSTGVVTLASSVLTTTDINAGTIDGTVIGGTTPAAITGTTITGTSFVSSGDMTFGDNDKAVFGAGSDLQIYHDGSNSYISEVGAGDLILVTNGSTINLQATPGAEYMARFYQNAQVELYYDNALKIATTATGIDVTGTVTADGLTVDGALSVNTAGNLLTLNATSGVAYQAFKENGTNRFFLGTLNGSDGLAFIDADGGSERMRIDSSGNVGIGTSSPSSKLTVLDGDIEISATAAGNTLLSFNGTTANLTVNSSTAPLVFGTNSTERMRIDSSGNLLVGTTDGTPYASNVSGAVFYSNGAISGSVDGLPALYLNRKTSDGTIADFRKDGSTVGSISVTASATAYNTSSDERLKEKITDAPAGNVDDIKVRSFDWKADGSHQDYGMVAQELEAVAPYAVTKGETEDDMWSVDYSKLVPMLIKEIQDLKAEVAALKGAN